MTHMASQGLRASGRAEDHSEQQSKGSEKMWVCLSPISLSLPVTDPVDISAVAVLEGELVLNKQQAFKCFFQNIFSMDFLNARDSIVRNSFP